MQAALERARTEAGTHRDERELVLDLEPKNETHRKHTHDVTTDPADRFSCNLGDA